MKTLEEMKKGQIEEIINDADLTTRKKANRIKKIEAAFSVIEKAAVVTGIEINVDWSKSAMWGMNPTAKIWINTIENKFLPQLIGKASGCGYDKESAAVASALNQSHEITKMLLDFAEGKTGSCEEVFGYGIWQFENHFPIFSGGVGINCFLEILKKIGFVCVKHHSKFNNWYKFTRS